MAHRSTTGVLDELEAEEVDEEPRGAQPWELSFSFGHCRLPSFVPGQVMTPTSGPLRRLFSTELSLSAATEY
jgi:hypothetical protein